MSNRKPVWSIALLAAYLQAQEALPQEALISHLPAADLGLFVAAELDLATVQSSLNPRRGVHQRRFADLGLTITEASAERAVLESEYEYMVVRVLQRGDANRDGVEDLVICLSDNAKQGTYRALTPYVLQKYSATTPLVALAWRPPTRARETCGAND